MSELRHLLHLVVEEVCSSWPPLTISSPLKKGRSRTRFFRERLTTKHMVNSPQNQFVSCAKPGICVKTKLLCSRRRAMEVTCPGHQLGWRSCRHEPCLMTWHVRGRLEGLMCFHVDDVMISGPRDDSEFKRMMDKVKRLYEWSEWEQHEFDQCGCRIRQATDKSVTVDQESYARKISLITLSAHRRKHMSEILSAEEHTTLMAKRGELNWSTVSSTESHRHIENCHRTTSQRCDSPRATGSL